MGLNTSLLVILFVVFADQHSISYSARLQSKTGQCTYNVQVWQPNDDVWKKLSDLDYKIEGVSARLNQDVLSLKVQMFQELLNEKNASVNVERGINYLDVKLAKFETDLQSASSSLRNIEGSIFRLSSTVEGIGDQNQKILLEQDSLDLKTQDSKKQLAAIHDFTSQLRNNVGDLKAEWILVKREMRNIQGENIQLKLGQNDLQANVNKLRDFFSQVQKNIDSLKTEISDIKTETKEGKKHIETMRLSLTKLREEQSNMMIETMKTQQRFFVANPSGPPIMEEFKKLKMDYFNFRKFVVESLKGGNASFSRSALTFLNNYNLGSGPTGGLNSIVPTDCQAVYDQGFRVSGLYKIQPFGENYADDVYCEMIENEGWTVIQRRLDGSQDFDRHWVEYKFGFGNPYAEFWMGNKKIHYLTNQRKYKLRIELWDWEGGKKFAEYKWFSVGDERENYPLHVLGYHGDAGDSLSYHDQMEFSTKDMDNDKYEGNCAEVNKGGWWFKNCYASNLNGAYKMGWYMSEEQSQRLNRNAEGIVWYALRGSELYSLKKVEMKVRPSD